jgi:Spy/CpxP family protein refolding chaperone
MKAHLFTIGLLLAAAVSIAQADNHPEKDGRPDQGKRMMQQLDLSEEQREQMREIREQGGSREEAMAVLTDEQRQKAEALRRAHGEERLKRMREDLDLTDEQVAQIKEIRENNGSREEIQAVLTEEQREKARQHRKKMSGKRKSAPADDE